MKISKRATEITSSLTRKLFNMAQNYHDVIDLTLGDPDFDTPKEIKKFACESIVHNKTHYSANAGLLEVRRSAAERVQKIWSVECDENNIMLTVGGMEALYLSLLSIIDEGDEVIVFAPYYVNYLQMIKMCGGTPVIIDTYKNDGFSIEKNSILEKITEKTVAVIINSPNNPTGEVYNENALAEIYNIACENNLYIIADEVYRTLIYDNLVHKSVLEFNDALKRTVLIDSMSKEFSMTGWRIGYVCANETIIQTMTKIQENIVACASLPSQYAMLCAYENNIKCNDMKSEFQRRRDFLWEEIQKIDKLSALKPKGTFYMFVNIEQTKLRSEEFAQKLLETQHIAVVPGKAYGETYDRYVRIAFTKNIDILENAVKKIKEFVDLL